MAIQVKSRRTEVGLVPHRGQRKCNVRVPGQQGLATGGALPRNSPGIAALHQRNRGHVHRFLADAGQVVQPIPILCIQRQGGDYALGLPINVKYLEVLQPQFVPHVCHHRFGLESRGKAVGQVTRDGKGVFRGEGLFGDTQDVKLHRRLAGGLVLVNAVQVG